MVVRRESIIVVNQRNRGMHVSGAIQTQLEPKCPRCGYDLRGETLQWTEQCPLDGRCTECGLSLEWVDVLSVKRQRPHWFVEYADGIRSLIARTPKTLFKMFRPIAFWRDVQMWHRVQWPRLMTYLILIAVVLYLLCGAVNAATFVASWINQVNDATAKVFVQPKPFETQKLAQAFFDPFNRNSMIDRSDQRTFFEIAPFIIEYLVLCPVGMALLPASRRIAKVRWSHVVRIALHGTNCFALIAVLAIAGCGVAELGRIHTSIGSVDLTDIAWYALCATPVYQFIWWSVATKHYLKMKHAWGVGAAVVIIAALTTMLINVSIALYRSTMELYGGW